MPHFLPSLEQSLANILKIWTFKEEQYLDKKNYKLNIDQGSEYSKKN